MEIFNDIPLFERIAWVTAIICFIMLMVLEVRG